MQIYMHLQTFLHAHKGTHKSMKKYTITEKYTNFQTTKAITPLLPVPLEMLRHHYVELYCGLCSAHFGYFFYWYLRCQRVRCNGNVHFDKPALQLDRQGLEQ